MLPEQCRVGQRVCRKDAVLETGYVCALAFAMNDYGGLVPSASVVWQDYKVTEHDVDTLFEVLDVVYDMKRGVWTRLGGK